MAAQKTITIPSMSCGHCLARIQRHLGQLKGVDEVSGTPETRILTVSWQEDTLPWQAINSALTEIGYPPAA